MKSIYIKLIKISNNGMHVQFSKEPDKVWFFIPGSTKPSKNPKNYCRGFPALYSVDDLIALLRSIPQIDPKNTLLDFDGKIAILSSRTFRRKKYKIGSCGNKKTIEQRKVSPLRHTVEFDFSK